MKNKRIPDIRLAGFTEEWELSRLGEISEKVTEKNKNNIYSETLTNSAEFGIINQRDFFDKDISNEKNLDGYYVVQPDDFVYNPRISNLAPVGPIKRNKLGRTGVMSPLYYVFRTYDVDKTYLEKYFSSDKWHQFMKLNGDSGARSDRFAIKDSIFRKMPIPNPSIEEQSKIGDFFEQLDNNIALHQKELITLKQTKLGFLQKLFPKEGESVPEVRFQGFTGDWEQHILCDVADMFDNLRIPVTASERIKGTTPYYGANGIQDYVEGYTHDGEFVLVAEDGANDLINYPVNYVTGKVWVNNHAHVISGKKDTLDNLFLVNRIRSMNISTYLVGGSRAKLNGETLKKIPVTIPSFEEQKTIGNFLKRLDEIIALQQSELDVLKDTKIAFLQKMFV